MREVTVQIRTRDGEMPVHVFVPDDVETCPGLVVYMDAFGIRNELLDICRRYATAGYAVFLPNLFYRLGCPVFPPANRRAEPLPIGMQEANRATSIAMTASDLDGLITFADRGAAGAAVRVFGAVGYCMGGRHALSAAASRPDRIGFAASIHGGQFVNDRPDSPHLAIERTPARLYFAFAENDETCPDGHQGLIEGIAARTGGRATCERYAALHGWTFPDRWCFDRRAADLVWERVLRMAKDTLWEPHTPRHLPLN
jgi:carboxymethylenebutenolidase